MRCVLPYSATKLALPRRARFRILLLIGLLVTTSEADPTNIVANLPADLTRSSIEQLMTIQVDKDSGFQRLDGETNQCVVVTVTDTGAGMSEQVKAHLFEPFFTTKEVGRGTGLGLAASYGIIQQRNGHIRVQSELGKGTTFDIYLPVVAGAAEATAGSESAPGKKGTETILVVEDEPKVRGLVVDVLRESGNTVLEANNGVEGLQVVQQDPTRRIDLVVTDVIMPQMSGKELAVQLRRIRPQTRVLFTLGYTDDALAQHGVLDPDIDFLEKPFTPSRLTFKVRKALESMVAA